MPRRVIEVDEALKWIERKKNQESYGMLDACDVQMWRPADVASPDDGEWSQVRVQAEQVQRYLNKGFKAEDPTPAGVEGPDYSESTVGDLLRVASDLGVDLKGVRRKADIIEALNRV